MKECNGKEEMKKRGNKKEEILFDRSNMTWFIKRRERQRRTQKKQNERLKME